MLPGLSPALTSYSSPLGYLGFQDKLQGLAYKAFPDVAPASSPDFSFPPASHSHLFSGSAVLS